MRFVDTSSLDAKDTLAAWFREAAKDGISEIYIQTGYLANGSVDFLISAAPPATLSKCKARVIIGSNDPRTYAPDIETVIDVFRVPRPSAKLGVVAFDDGLFHPKSYVIKRIDGTMTAYVGSANFTPSGLSKNIEAGIIIDSRESSGVTDLCSQIANSIDTWFSRGESEGFYTITGKDDVSLLVNIGILSLTPAPKKPSLNSAGMIGSTKAELRKLKPLVTWPKISASVSTSTVVAGESLAKFSEKNTPKKAPELAPSIGDIFIAETTKGRAGRSRQIDVNKHASETYFGGVGTKLICIPVSREGILGNAEARVIGTKSSNNYYLELSGLKGSFTGQDYRERPLLLMAKYPSNESNYMFFWIYPDDPQFGTVYDSFIGPQVPSRKGINSIKLVRPYFSLKNVWPDNPFERALLKAGRQ